MSDLKLIKKEVLEDEKSNFWNSCPRKLEYLPEESCYLGTPEKSKDNRILKCPECPWWINSPAHNYCFWAYLKDKSESDGSMKELVQSDLSKLFGWSSNKTHLYIKEAMEELTKAFKKHDLMDELGDFAENFEMLNISDISNSSKD